MKLESDALYGVGDDRPQRGRTCFDLSSHADEKGPSENEADFSREQNRLAGPEALPGAQRRVKGSPTKKTVAGSAVSLPCGSDHLPLPPSEPHHLRRKKR